MKSMSIAIAALSAASALFAIVGGRDAAKGNTVELPPGLARAVLYHSTDNAKAKQHRELYASSDAIAAAVNGRPLPPGAVLAMAMFRAKLDADGNPLKDSDGRFVKDTLVAWGVMSKRGGGGAAYPAEIRNGEWEYQSYNPDMSVNAAAKISACLECHNSQEKSDYVFSLDCLKMAK